MPDRLMELSRGDLFVQAARLIERAHPDEPAASARTMLERYYCFVPPDELAERQPEDLAGVVLTHRELAETRPPGEARVRVFTPTLRSHGWTTGHSVLDIVVDDMPFLVDSVAIALARQSRPVHLVVHPVLRVRRDEAGRLLEVLLDEQSDVAGSASADDGVVTESWMHVEFERETDPTDLAAVEQAVHRVLHDVAIAVADYRPMQARMIETAADIASRPPPVGEHEAVEAEELLRWLADDHFTYLGYREYRLDRDDHHDVLRRVPGTGLGLLRVDPGSEPAFSTLPEAVRAKARELSLLILTKANSRATVHRDAYLDYVGVKVFGTGEQAHEVVGERRFLGLFASTVYHESVRRIPLLRGKVARVLEASGFAAGSHRAKDLLQVLETYPRDELFQISVPRLAEITTALVELQGRRQVRLFARPDDYGRFLSCLVYLPQERMSTQVRLRVTDILLRATGGETVDYAVRIGQSVHAQLHLVIRMRAGQRLPDLDLALLEHELAAAVRSWDDDLAAALVEQVGEEEASRLERIYSHAFSDGYKEDFSPRLAVTDLQQLESLGENALAVNLYQRPGSPSSDRRFKIYSTGPPMTLSQVLPLLTDFGVTVVDEWPYDIQRAEGPTAHIYDFGLRYDGPDLSADQGSKTRFERAFSAVWAGTHESDGLNRLVLLAGLDHRRCGVLRGYARYLRQTGSTFSPAYVEEALLAHPHLAGTLVELFTARFDPRLSGPNGAALELDDRRRVVDRLFAELTAALDEVASLDHDRILRSLTGLIMATLRTNHFTADPVDADGDVHDKEYLSLKLDPQQIPELPEPRPFAEIWVSSPRVEGVHLRFGRVARGGLRWSDRREDFRTEVLGLVKAQAVKNSVIVPVGAKGGFVLRSLPDPELGRPAVLEAGMAAYRVFVRGMLEVTDSWQAGSGGAAVRHTPADVVRWDDPDPYLVVAADKGTATFSDVANEIALEMGFWLGDAFASGGSTGYDHKAMGITARGAWESVRRHFRRLGRDCQREDFSCVGIGDMSGDVFGNAMLLSTHTRLVAAFDHRHVFIDPDPDPAVSHAERARLFALPRSSWADYDADLISAGGGVWPRSAKSVPVSPQARATLGLDDEVVALTPSELISAILQAPVDLLFNGGIGTYVKASTETNMQVGDKANDAVRVDASTVRATIVAEGGNLGLTQRARVQLARAGVAVNTDAIDNSAGVDTSDHEVNLKILLDAAVRDGDLTTKQRNVLLEEMTDDVGRLVLRHNYEQTGTLDLAVSQAEALLSVHGAYLRSLERRGIIDRELESLPDNDELRRRRAAGEGLTAPELAVLLGYTKNWLFAELLATSLPDEDVSGRLLVEYFPTAVSRRFPNRVAEHPLRREIISTMLANRLVDEAGISFLYRLGLETAAGPAELCRSQLIARAVFDLAGITADIDALDHQVDADVQVSMRLAARQVVERASRWFVLRRGSGVNATDQIDAFGEPVGRVLDALPELLTGQLAQTAASHRDRLVDAGVPVALARRVAVLRHGPAALSVVECARDLDADLLEVARVHLAVGERMGLDRLHDRVVALPREDNWQTMARAALRDDLSSLHAALTTEIMARSGTGAPTDRLVAWEAQDNESVRRARALLRDVLSEEAGDLARLSVGLRAVRTVLRGGSA